MTSRAVVIEVGADSVDGLLVLPASARACFVFAHGAGAGMAHPFMADVARGLAERAIATLRFQFPAMQRGSKRTDSPAVAQATVRAAVAHAAATLSDLPLVAGGKSFGGRMTSQAEASLPLPGVLGLVFLGFPLHPDGQPAATRGAHLSAVHKPMLFLQGTRDKLATPSLLQPLVAALGPRATLAPIADADHSFHVLVRSGRSDAHVMAELVTRCADWVGSLTGR